MMLSFQPGTSDLLSGHDKVHRDNRSESAAIPGDNTGHELLPVIWQLPE
jgi:hypothetical protein